MNEPQQTITVMVRSHLDNTGFKVVRVYTNPLRAAQDLELVEDDLAKVYEIYSVPLFTGAER